MAITNSNRPIAAAIDEIITKKGFKQRAVAERAGMSAQAFNDMINGRKIIKACDIPCIAKALEVTPNDLYGITSGQFSQTSA